MPAPHLHKASGSALQRSLAEEAEHTQNARAVSVDEILHVVLIPRHLLGVPRMRYCIVSVAWQRLCVSICAFVPVKASKLSTEGERARHACTQLVLAHQLPPPPAASVFVLLYQ